MASDSETTGSASQSQEDSTPKRRKKTPRSPITKNWVDLLHSFVPFNVMIGDIVNEALLTPTGFQISMQTLENTEDDLEPFRDVIAYMKESLNNAIQKGGNAATDPNQAGPSNSNISNRNISPGKPRKEGSPVSPVKYPEIKTDLRQQLLAFQAKVLIKTSQATLDLPKLQQLLKKVGIIEDLLNQAKKEIQRGKARIEKNIAEYGNKQTAGSYGQ